MIDIQEELYSNVDFVLINARPNVKPLQCNQTNLSLLLSQPVTAQVKKDGGKKPSGDIV